MWPLTEALASQGGSPSGQEENQSPTPDGHGDVNPPALFQAHLGHCWDRRDRGQGGLWCLTLGVPVRPRLPSELLLTGDHMVQLQFPSWHVPSMSCRTHRTLSGCGSHCPSLSEVEEVTTIHRCEYLQYSFFTLKWTSKGYLGSSQTAPHPAPCTHSF